MNITKTDTKLHASAKAVIVNFLSLPGGERVGNIVQRVKNLSDDEVEALLKKVMTDFAERHRNIEDLFLDHFNRINDQCKEDLSSFSATGKLLLGALFSKEYSIQAAALFNPSIVPHPDQQGLQKGEQRFIMSLRATGEGHISSIVFQTGIVNNQLNIILDKPTGYFTSLKKNEGSIYEKAFIVKCASFFPGFKMELLNILPGTFTADTAIRLINESLIDAYPTLVDSVQQLKTILDTNYDLLSSAHLPLNERVIFPNAKAESMGMEDVRFVKFEEAEGVRYYGTYTAYNGHQIKTQLIETKDFDVFKLRTLYGKAISDKGMALFPEKINGKYVMISRQGGEMINIMFSEDLYHWQDYQLLMAPKYPWELVQLGNCGSPVKTGKGWLLLTHGVGAMRTYVISAILLDLSDPTKIIGRLDTPLITADEAEREGYVPNVVYTCGLLRHGDTLVIPYAVSDSATGFATISLADLLNELTK